MLTTAQENGEAALELIYTEDAKGEKKKDNWIEFHQAEIGRDIWFIFGPGDCYLPFKHNEQLSSNRMVLQKCLSACSADMSLAFTCSILQNTRQYAYPN